MKRFLFILVLVGLIAATVTATAYTNGVYTNSDQQVEIIKSKKCYYLKKKFGKYSYVYKKHCVIPTPEPDPLPLPDTTPAPVLADPDRTGYCTPKPVVRFEDGSFGHFIDVLPDSYATDPAYSGAVPAYFVVGIGTMCGPLPAGYKLTGRLVNDDGEFIEHAQGNVHPEAVKG